MQVLPAVFYYHDLQTGDEEGYFGGSNVRKDCAQPTNPEISVATFSRTPMEETIPQIPLGAGYVRLYDL